MRPHTCPFYQSRHTLQGDIRFCGIGLNFCDVGIEATLCGTCRIPELVEHINCEHLDVSAVLRPHPSGGWRVKPQLYCVQKQLLVDEPSCLQCPLRLKTVMPKLMRQNTSIQKPYLKG